MSIHFNISPPTKPLRAPSIKVTEVLEPPCLSLTCFAPNVKLDFENVTIGTTATQQVLIKNPSEHNIEISLLNLPPAEKGVTVSWHKQIISKHETVALQISWRPIMEDSWRHTFKLEDGHRIKKSISVVFKSIKISKKATEHCKKRKTVLARKNVFSPKYKKSTRNNANDFASKENCDPNYNSFLQSSNNTFTIKCFDNEIRRETYSINGFKPLKENSICAESNDNNETFSRTLCREVNISKDFSDDSLEIESNRQTSFEHKASPLVTNRNSTYTLTTNSQRNSFSPRYYTSVKKHFSTLETPIKQDVQHHCSIKKLKRKSSSIFNVSPPKRLQLDHQQEQTKTPCKNIKRPTVNPYLLSADPFLSSLADYDQSWISEQEERFKKWLNCLLMPPAELHSNAEAHTVDAAKLWQECKNKPSEVPLTKEVVSFQYHTNKHLDALRTSARNIYNSPEISTVLLKIKAVINADKLSIRSDRNIHANIGLQSNILTILLCYNPLWLRIGLEVIYNTTIPLLSNSDIMGLTNFIMQRFFKDPALLKKHKSVFTPKYILAIKQFALKQFLALVYFLDIAKTQVLIPHDPCLFCKNAPYKESREILFAFARELLAAVGDITRFLRRFGYVVAHEQKYIHEFDFSVIHLGSDLQDGVRLTKVLEIILVQTGLIEKLRVPAISKLQKIYNVDNIFTALTNANFIIAGDILPKDIVEGHHEKTLSFLWQIIYKFQAPILIKAASKIQHWWRSFPISIKRHILDKPHKAATKIQTQYRCYKAMQVQRVRFLKMKSAAIFIQKWYRIKRVERAVLVIQRRYRAYKSMKVTQACFISLKAATLIIQRHFRMRKEIKFGAIRRAVIKIQQRFRANKLMKSERLKFLALKDATVKIQRRYRATQAMRNASAEYERLKSVAICTQQRFRANQLTKRERSQYTLLKQAVIKVQRRFQANQATAICSRRFQSLKAATISIQRRFRANCAMKRDRFVFTELRAATIVIQQRFRSIKEMRTEQTKFSRLKQAAIVIQQRFKANRLRNITHTEYDNLRKATIIVQRRFRANNAMKRDLSRFIAMRGAALKLQQKFRAKRKMEFERTNYCKLKEAATVIQQRFKANCMRNRALNNFSELKKSVIIIQRRFRANKAMKNDHCSFITLKLTVVKIQSLFRANRMMKLEQHRFLTLKQAVVTVQRRFKANRARQVCTNDYCRLRSSVITIQRRFRATKAMKNDYSSYITLKITVVKIQSLFRANRMMKLEQRTFLTLKQAVVTVQRRFKANRARRVCTNDYCRLRSSVIAIQRRFRANRQMKQQRLLFNQYRNAVLQIQQRFRANCLMTKQRSTYHRQRTGIIFIQRQFRANKAMKDKHQQFLCLKQAVINIQCRFRANRLMKQHRNSFQNLKRAAISIQNHYRAKIQMQLARSRYRCLKQTVLKVQRQFRAKMAMRVCCIEYNKIKTAVITIQRRYRANKAMQPIYIQYTNLRRVAISIQQRFRANRAMRLKSQHYTALKNAVVIIQRRFRNLKAISKDRKGFVVYRNTRRAAATKIQAFWRGHRARTSHPEMSRIRENSKEVNSLAQPQNTLGVRKIQALQLLKSINPSLLHIIRALEDLDFITRRCKDTCITLSKALPEFLYCIIRSGNRSLPDMEACAAATGVLINFYKYQPSSQAAWIPEHMDNVFTILIHCCDKEHKLFLYLSTLVWLFAHNEKYLTIMTTIPNFYLILSKIQWMCLRKQKMVQQHRSYNPLSIFLPYGDLPMPSQVPDWGLEHPQRPRLFSNSMHALKCLVEVLKCK